MTKAAPQRRRARPATESPARRKRGREGSRSPRRPSPSSPPKARPETTDIGDKSALDSSDISSIGDEWTGDKPGMKCTMDELRWFTIREMGGLKVKIKDMNRIINKQQTELEIAKMKITERPTRHDMDNNIKQALGDYYSKNDNNIIFETLKKTM